MKVLMVGLTPPLEGGSERHIYELSNRIECDVFTQKGSLCDSKVETPLFFKNKTLLRNIFFACCFYLYSIRLLFAFKKKYDIIHIHENILYPCVILLMFRYKIVITVHGLKGFKFYDNKLLWYLFGSCLCLADSIISVSQTDKILLGNLNIVTYIPNGVDLSYYGEKNG